MEVMANIKILIVDTHNKPFHAETLRWWYPSMPTNMHSLKCIQKQCTIWFLREALTQTITIRANTSIVEPNDASCWSLYHGETVLDPFVKEAKIVMEYNNKVCK